ncbi:MAG: SpoIIE family protein phosphatase [Streptomyces sp.]|nr:SpoIIE family protein phosphatase [Streptomyces sp.]
MYDPVSGRCAMAGAGHPPPVPAAPDGTVRFLELPAGPPLGRGGTPFEAAEFHVAENSVLARTRPPMGGDLRPDPARPAPSAPDGPCRSRDPGP